MLLKPIEDEHPFQAVVGCGRYLCSTGFFANEAVMMRVELVYSPGVTNQKELLESLQMVIAEERLPLPVEVIEDKWSQLEFPAAAAVRVLTDSGQPVTLQYYDSALLPTRSLESLREFICKTWREVTVEPIVQIHRQVT